ncbi:unnamed protein product, partial [Vitis vinifera]
MQQKTTTSHRAFTRRDQIIQYLPFSSQIMQAQILLVTYPAQGHINPSLQLAKLLTRAGAHVTFVTSSSASTRMSKPPTLEGLEFVTFSDGYDHGFKHGDDLQNFMSELDRLGSQALTELIVARANEGRPFTCLLYGIIIPWVAEVAQSFHLPSALVWSQAATVFDIYYYYFNEPSKAIAFNFVLKSLQKQLEQLNRESNPRVLVNSFDALESEALRALNKFKLMGIGPLLPLAFLDGKDPSDTSFGGDLFRDSKDYIQWLNSKPESSVIYVSFGSLSVLSKQQSEEIARGLLASGRPFLWVIRAKENGEEEKEDDKLMVAFPQWTDQTTNAKLIEDVWKTGLRVMVNQEGIVEGGEIKKCLELVMGCGEKGQEVRRNAKKWKDLAREAVKEGGSSDKNLKNFVNEIIQGY